MVELIHKFCEPMDTTTRSRMLPPYADINFLGEFSCVLSVVLEYSLTVLKVRFGENVLMFMCRI